MKYVYKEVNSLDKRCYESYGLTEELLMENAAGEICQYIRNNFSKDKTILIVCGSGNNGGDGLVVARRLHQEYQIRLYLAGQPKNALVGVQFERAQKVGVTLVDKIIDADIVVDALFGTGISRELEENYQIILDAMNLIQGYKIACDIPSGIGFAMRPFKADTTITMGAYKKILFEDFAKDFLGEVIVANLGVSDSLYETTSNLRLLEKSDMRLPWRKTLATHKGNYGHLCIVLGSKKGAGTLSSLAALNFGVGLVSVLSHTEANISPMVMSTHFIPNNANVICIGMGLGNDFDDIELKKILQNDLKKVIDADLFMNENILGVLNQEVILTPHPKEFLSLLKLTDIANINMDELLQDRFKYVQLFCLKYPMIVLVLKGANTLIGFKDQIYINSFASPALAKGGSGDILSGILGALMSQNYSPLEAAITGSLALSLASMNYDKNNYSMTPLDLIERLKDLHE